MKKTFITHTKIQIFTGASAVLFALAPKANAVTIIYEDNFDGLDSVDLGTTTPDVSLTGSGWVTAFSRATGAADSGAAQIFNADGSVIKDGPNPSHDAGALLPFVIEADTIYRLEAVFTNNNERWLAFGFASGNSQLDGSNGRHSNSSASVFGGYAWGLSRNRSDGDNQSFFNGIGTGGPISGGNFAADQEITMAIILNTADTNAIAAEYFINGIKQGDTQSLPESAFGDIDFVGVSSDGLTGDAPASISSFALTIIPEPSSLVLLGLGSIGLLGRRRS